MTRQPVNEALPRASQRLLENYLDGCQNLGLLLDKLAPFSTSRKAKGDETKSLFESERTDVLPMNAQQRRWTQTVQDANGLIFQMQLMERMVAGLGASHVLETGLTLDRNTGLSYLPGSTVKGLARAWGLIETAAQLGIKLDDKVKTRSQEIPALNRLASTIISAKDEELFAALEEPNLLTISEDARFFINGFRFIFGSQANAGAINFLDAIYYGSQPPRYAADVMTPHYVQYYTNNGGQPPTEEDSPNPVSFITVDRGNVFAFGLIPRQSAFRNLTVKHQQTMLGAARDWLARALAELGAGSKTAAGYGFFSKKSFQQIHPS